METLTHYYSGRQADVVNAWIESNPTFHNTGENAARIAARIGSSVSAESLDAAWEQVKANPNPPANPDGAGSLARKLRARVESCPIQGARNQMLTALDVLDSAGGPWLRMDGRE